MSEAILLLAGIVERHAWILFGLAVWLTFLTVYVLRRRK